MQSTSRTLSGMYSDLEESTQTPRCTLLIGQVATTSALLSAVATGFCAHAQTERPDQGRTLKTLKQEIAVLRAAHASFNRGDFEGDVSSLDPHIEWIEWGSGSLLFGAGHAHHCSG